MESIAASGRAPSLDGTSTGFAAADGRAPQPHAPLAPSHRDGQGVAVPTEAPLPVPYFSLRVLLPGCRGVLGPFGSGLLLRVCLLWGRAAAAALWRGVGGGGGSGLGFAGLLGIERHLFFGLRRSLSIGRNSRIGRLGRFAVAVLPYLCLIARTLLITDVNGNLVGCLA